MQTASMTMDRYLAQSMRSVEGYLTGLDAKVIATLLRAQAARQHAGHLCEIGVHHGRLFFLLALARRPDERALAVDLFEDDAINQNTRHAGRNTALFTNAKRLGIELRDEETYKTSSLDISAANILERTGGAVRFFSVDGSHLYAPVLNDLALARDTLTAEGVIAVDDFFNMDWPEVTFATHDFLRQSDGRLVPFAITSSKLYLAPREAAAAYKAALQAAVEPQHSSTVPMLGQEVLSLHIGRAEKAYEMLRKFVG